MTYKEKVNMISQLLAIYYDIDSGTDSYAAGILDAIYSVTNFHEEVKE